jgi:archaellum component FlaF (FlaF/FlaG flagellin family)
MITLVSSFFSQPLISFGAIILLLSVIMITAMETTVYAQLLPKTVNIDNATNKLPTSAQAKSNMHLVKITSPIKGQQIPVRSSITVTGTSISKSPDCGVSVIVNGIKPYQKAVPTGTGMANNYSTWTYTITPTLIKLGQNKITAKFSCGNNVNFTPHNSVNVTGVGNTSPIPTTPALITPNSTHANKGVNCRFFIYSPGPCS